MKSKPTSTHIIEYKSLIYNRERFEIGDSVSIRVKGDRGEYGLIKRIWRNEKIHDGFITISWYVKPEEIFKIVPKFISVAEVFSSDYTQDISVACIQEKIKVMDFEKYHELNEVEDDIYFTRAQYSFKTKKLSPQISDWKQICYCRETINPDHEYLCCDSCNELFHIECTDYVRGSESNWYCGICLDI